MKFSGAVEKILETGKRVEVKGKKETMTLTVGDRPKITKAGKEMPFAEFKRNMEVGVDDMKEADYNSKGQERPSLFKKNAKKTLLKKMLDISPTIKYVFVDDKTQIMIEILNARDARRGSAMISPSFWTFECRD